MNLCQEDKRVIDTNELVSKRIEELTVKMQRASGGGFVSGLEAPVLEVDEALSEEEKADIGQTNIIKANQDAQKIRMSAKQEAETLSLLIDWQIMFQRYGYESVDDLIDTILFVEKEYCRIRKENK